MLQGSFRGLYDLLAVDLLYAAVWFGGYSNPPNYLREQLAHCASLDLLKISRTHDSPRVSKILARKSCPALFSYNTFFNLEFGWDISQIGHIMTRII